MAVTLKPLAEQTLVITGASSGIGLATARRAAREGANVVLVARNEAALIEAVESIRVRGGRATHCAVDVTDAGAGALIGAVARSEFGGFDTWVNNAAAAVYARLEDTGMEEHRRVFETGYFALVSLSLYAAEQLRTRGGAIINIGSVLGERAVQIQGAYSAMKHAVGGFTESFRVELEEAGAPISVTLIKPHGINTPYPEHARNKLDKPARVPPIVYDPELVAKAICFAAAHPKRDLTVGGQGLVMVQLAKVMPRTTDRIMEMVFGKLAQTTDTPPEPGAEDNLFQPRKDGRERSNQPIASRKTSLALEAQMRPLAAAAIVAGAGAAAFLGYRALRPSPALDAEREAIETVPIGLGAHQPDGQDSSASFEAGIADESTIPEALPA